MPKLISVIDVVKQKLKKVKSGVLTSVPSGARLIGQQLLASAFDLPTEAGPQLGNPKIGPSRH